MKKLVVALVAAVLVAAGLVGATGGSANAACQVYTGCLDTVTKTAGPGSVRKGKRAILCARTTARGSNAHPVGRLVFKVTRNRGGFKFTKNLAYGGGKQCTKTRKLRKRGGYTLEVYYRPRSGAAFNPSNDGVGFDVR